MERIQGLEKMNREEITVMLSGIMAKAEEDAAELRAEIKKSYSEREQVESRMHAAANSKDMDAYRENRMRFDMLTEFIGNAEKRVDELESGPLLDNKDFMTIKRQLLRECHDATIGAAEKIALALRHIDKIGNAHKSYISGQNAALITLARCAREKDKDGEIKSEFSLMYNDVIVEPFVENLGLLKGGTAAIVDNMAFANFAIFYKDYCNKNTQPGPDA